MKDALLFLNRLATEGGAIVSSSKCHEMEIAFARAEGRFLVSDDGLGYVLRTEAWRELAEQSIHEYTLESE